MFLQSAPYQSFKRMIVTTYTASGMDPVKKAKLKDTFLNILVHERTLSYADVPAAFAVTKHGSYIFRIETHVHFQEKYVRNQPTVGNNVDSVNVCFTLKFIGDSAAQIDEAYFMNNEPVTVSRLQHIMNECYAHHHCLRTKRAGGTRVSVSWEYAAEYQYCHQYMYQHPPEGTLRELDNMREDERKLYMGVFVLVRDDTTYAKYLEWFDSECLTPISSSAKTASEVIGQKVSELSFVERRKFVAVVSERQYDYAWIQNEWFEYVYKYFRLSVDEFRRMLEYWSDLVCSDYLPMLLVRKMHY